MRKIALAIVTAAFAATSLAAAVQAAGKPKAKPGMCGENMYYDTKARKCADARNKK